MTTPSQTESDELEMARLLGEAVTKALPGSPMSPKTRAQLLDLLEVPRGPVDRSAYPWLDVGPGLKLHVVSDDAARGVKRCLVWGAPGASTVRHGHSGDELILVLEGHLTACFAAMEDELARNASLVGPVRGPSGRIFDLVSR